MVKLSPSFSVFPLFLIVKGNFVNKDVPEVPRSLSNFDFVFASTLKEEGQPFDPKKALRDDLLEGDMIQGWSTTGQSG